MLQGQQEQKRFAPHKPTSAATMGAQQSIVEVPDTDPNLASKPVPFEQPSAKETLSKIQSTDEDDTDISLAARHAEDLVRSGSLPDAEERHHDPTSAEGGETVQKTSPAPNPTPAAAPEPTAPPAPSVPLADPLLPPAVPPAAGSKAVEALSAAPKAGIAAAAPKAKPTASAASKAVPAGAALKAEAASPASKAASASAASKAGTVAAAAVAAGFRSTRNAVTSGFRSTRKAAGIVASKADSLEGPNQMEGPEEAARARAKAAKAAEAAAKTAAKATARESARAERAVAKATAQAEVKEHAAARAAKPAADLGPTLDRAGPNIASGPIPSDGFTTDAYKEYTKRKLSAMAQADVRAGTFGIPPDETRRDELSRPMEHDTDYLDKLEHLGASQKGGSSGIAGGAALGGAAGGAADSFDSSAFRINSTFGRRCDSISSSALSSSAVQPGAAGAAPSELSVVEEAWLLVKYASGRQATGGALAGGPQRHAEALSKLLEARVDPNVLVPVGWREWPSTPLVEAAAAGHTRMVRALLNAHADVNTRVGRGYTALYQACFNGHTEVVRLLLENRADVGASRKDDFSPLYIAAQEGHALCVNALLEWHAPPDEATWKDPTGRIRVPGSSALYIACQNGHAECVESLLDSGATPDLPMADGSTPLMIACFHQHLRVVEALLLAGASLDVRDKHGRDALGWAKMGKQHQPQLPPPQHPLQTTTKRHAKGEEAKSHAIHAKGEEAKSHAMIVRLIEAEHAARSADPNLAPRRQAQRLAQRTAAGHGVILLVTPEERNLILQHRQQASGGGGGGLYGGASGGGGGWFGIGARDGGSQAGSAGASAVTSAAGAADAESVMKIGGDQAERRSEQAGRRTEQTGQLRRPSSDSTSSVGHRAERRAERRLSSDSTSSGGQGGWFGLGARDGACADGAPAEGAITGAQKNDSSSSGGWFGQIDAQLNQGGWLGFGQIGRAGVTTVATSAAGLFVSLPPTPARGLTTALAPTQAPAPWRWPWEQPLAAPAGAAGALPTHSSGVTNRCLCCITCCLPSASQQAAAV